jgi:ABC-type multidrug transport system ATPase subunit
MSEGAEPPLLSFEAARIRLADGSSVGPFGARGEARRLGLLGAWQPLFDLLARTATLESGAVTLLGAPVERALKSGEVALVPLDPPLPPQWTSERYLSESARLLGERGRASVKRAQKALERFELGALGRRTLGSLSVLERRLLGVVRGALGAPRLLCCEAPLHRLPDSAQATLESAIERAAADRLLIVSAHALPRLGRERTLLERSEQLLLLDSDGMRSTTLDELDQSSTLSVVVSENPDAFARALAEQNLPVERLGPVEAAYALVFAHQRTECVRFLVRAADDSARRSILQASQAAAAPLLELVPR